ncbi:heme-containing dehydratase protein [Phaeosphaeria sp. MPI-PUGE-AT-0046c]|nr:heme-containing dehydratase protein [Phaeosphaeria sp. MPI-PUGE-AT-0046c]
MSCPARLYPFRKPPNHRVPVPRWKLHLPEDVVRVYTAYIGVQQHKDNEEAAKVTTLVVEQIQAWLKREDGPSASESFAALDLGDGADQDAVIWVCYWTDASRYRSSLEALSLPSMHSKLPSGDRDFVGIWRESFTSTVSRLETNYSGLDYLPGLARLPEASTEEHTLSAYWGAARDRIPDSAHDLFPRATEGVEIQPLPEKGAKHLIGSNRSNLVHIRSGQFWENCNETESTAYESKLEPTLEAGLRYLRSNPKQTGSINLRYMRNAALPLGPNIPARKETCGAGFFANLEDLERWAHTHPSHLKIYGGAMKHYKDFGDERRFRTWHEVSVIGEGDAGFEYVNCEMGEGVDGGMIRWKLN